MGTRCSKLSCDSICNCFTHDKNVGNIEIERDIKVKWKWTYKHESVFATILTDPEYKYNVPTVIVDLIQQLAYSKDEKYYVDRKRICNESYYNYSKQNQLLSKKLCSKWYHSKLSHLSSFPIVMFSPDKNKKEHILSTFSDSLQTIVSTSNNKMRSTLCINNCQITIDVFQMNNINDDSNYTVYFNQPIYLVLVDKNDSFNTINEQCSSIWNKHRSMDNCILVTENKKSETVKLVSEKWNVAYITVNYSQQKSINDMFKFAMKYYWFCRVMHLQCGSLTTV